MSANALVTEFLLAAEEGNIDALKAPITAWILTPPTARKEPPLLLPA